MANVETVQTSNATVGTVMTSGTVTDLPLTTRNYTNLLGLSAGANVAVYNAAGLGKGTQDISVNGGADYSRTTSKWTASPSIFPSGSGSAV